MKVCGTCKQEGGWEYSGQYHDLHGVCEVCGKFTQLWDCHKPATPAAGHTPGPWKIDEAGDLPLAVIQDTEDGLGICEIGYPETRSDKAGTEETANAKLIAAAPAMLEACRDAVAEYDIDGEVSTLSIMKLQKAIQQATQ